MADAYAPWHKQHMQRTRQQGDPSRPTWPLWALLFVWCFAIGGASFRSLASAAVLLTFGATLWWNERRARRPARSFIRLALGAALLFLFLVVETARQGGDFRLGAILWFGLSVLGAIWTIHYERTEPLT